jgi:hypothetical protein
MVHIKKKTLPYMKNFVQNFLGFIEILKEVDALQTCPHF